MSEPRPSLYRSIFRGQIVYVASGQARRIRAEGERAIGALRTALPTGWETWQPEADWAPLQLPDGWANV